MIIPAGFPVLILLGVLIYSCRVFGHFPGYLLRKQPQTIVPDGDGRIRIDYFMISKTGFRVLAYHVAEVVHEGVYVSDHNPIVLDVTLT